MTAEKRGKEKESGIRGAEDKVMRARCHRDPLLGIGHVMIINRHCLGLSLRVSFRAGGNARRVGSMGFRGRTIIVTL